MAAAIIYRWTGTAMEPLPGFIRWCADYFIVGNRYRLEEVQVRSKMSHDHFFAQLHDAWLGLPEVVAAEFYNEKHFRKWLLIEAGFYDEMRFKIASKDEAQRFAEFSRVQSVRHEDYARVDVLGQFVSIRTAKSQRMHGEGAMPPREFQQSKEGCFRVLEKLTGVDVTTLKRELGRSA